ncbi:hypothetical protein [Acutalibacter sp. 1XD8-36]|uniref:hypothetical protein n=1 Tax=Acutalibacter sp. 1XD8-36 TaxID=2320852 RepID=UPI002615BDCA|nr:hypothetical protein [Acutalibacter sp. 1XD8-36]
MPFIDVKASCEITASQELSLKEGLGEAITKIPGKSESRLMLCFQGGQHMWYAGKSDGPTVMVHTAIYGTTTPEAVESFGQAAVSLMREVLGAENVYLRMSQGTDWAF